MSKTNDVTKGKYDVHTKELKELNIGDSVLIQNDHTKRLGQIWNYYGSWQIQTVLCSCAWKWKTITS